MISVSRSGSIGGFGDLREQLLEVVVEQPRLVAEHGQRRVVAHRTQGLLRVLARGDHRQQELLDVLGRVAEALEQLQPPVRVRGGLAPGLGQVVKRQLLLAEPLPVGPLLGDPPLELLVGDDPALVEVHQQHPTRLQAALLDDGFRGDVHHADLAGEDHAVVVGHVVARGPQAVAVERPPR